MKSSVLKAQNSLLLKTDIEFGCHVVTQSLINAGTNILTTMAFACVDCLYNFGKGCFNCGNIPKQQIKCSYCNIWFCSELCKSRKSHRRRCDSRFLSSDCHLTRLVCEIIFVAVKKLGTIESVIEFYIKVISSQETNDFLQYAQIIQLKKRDKVSHSEIARRVAKIISGLYDVESIDLQRKLFHLAMCHVNCLELNEFSEDKRCTEGGGLKKYYIYDIISRFNHSCVPNIETYLNRKDEMMCVAARQILPGEQLFISYLGHNEFKSHMERKNYLKEGWNFDCKCEICVEVNIAETLGYIENII